MVSVLLVLSAIIAIVAVGLGLAYTTGNLDPIIERIGMYFFKAQAKAEEKKLQAQGLKEGEDFLKGQYFSFLRLSSAVPPWLESKSRMDL